MILWSLLFAGKQALSNVKNFLPMLVATFLLNLGGGGGGSKTKWSSFFSFCCFFFLLYCLWGAQIFLGRCHWVFLLFCFGWFLCWCILVPSCVHCFSVHCYRAVLLLEIYPRWPSCLRVVFLYLLVNFWWLRAGDYFGSGCNWWCCSVFCKVCMNLCGGHAWCRGTLWLFCLLPLQFSGRSL